MVVPSRPSGATTITKTNETNNTRGVTEMAAPKKTEVAKTDDVTDIINAPLAGAFDIPMTPGMSFDDYERALQGQIIDFEGSPYTVVDKETLIGKEFLITISAHSSETTDRPSASWRSPRTTSGSCS